LTCGNIIHTVDNETTPTDLILLDKANEETYSGAQAV
ncbi:unnamed protein product, partial [Rotaria sordida]